MSVYQGANSCYALNEQRYVERVRKPGIDTLREAAGILKLILRDYRRGWTYRQGDCKKIRMTRELFEKRVNFIKLLARRHGAKGAVLDTIDRLVDYVLEHKRLPKRLKLGKHYVDIKKLAEEAIVEKK